MSWKRAGGNTAFTLFILLPIACIGVGAVFLPIRQGLAVWSVQHKEFDSGIASRATPLTTPAGKGNVAAWVGRIGRKEGKSKSFHAYCTIAQIDGLAVGEHLLRGWDTPGTFALRETPAGDDLTSFDLAPSTEGIAPPDAAKAACAGSLYPADSVYDETTIPMGARVEISGCYGKDALTPCRSGADLVTVRNARDRFAAARTYAIVAELFCMFFTGLTLSYLGFTIAGVRIMLVRRKKKDVTAQVAA